MINYWASRIYKRFGGIIISVVVVLGAAGLGQLCLHLFGGEAWYVSFASLAFVVGVLITHIFEEKIRAKKYVWSCPEEACKFEVSSSTSHDVVLQIAANHERHHERGEL